MKKSEPILEIKPLSYAQLMRVEFFAPNRVPGMEAAYAYLEARKIKPPAWLPAAIVLMLLGIGVVYAVAK